MRLSTFSDYGIRVLMYTAALESQKNCTTRDISEYYDISYNHLVKVVHRLSTLGYLNIKKGRGGGIELGKDPRSIYLGDLIKDLEPDLNLVECFEKSNRNCKIMSFCKVKGHLERAKRTFLKELNKTNLFDLKENSEQSWLSL